GFRSYRFRLSASHSFSKRPPHPNPLPKGRGGRARRLRRRPFSPRGEGQDEGGLSEAMGLFVYHASLSPIRKFNARSSLIWGSTAPRPNSGAACFGGRKRTKCAGAFPE